MIADKYDKRSIAIFVKTLEVGIMLLAAPLAAAKDEDPYLWLEDVGGEKALAKIKSEGKLNARERVRHERVDRLGRRGHRHRLADLAAQDARAFRVDPAELVVAVRGFRQQQIAHALQIRPVLFLQQQCHRIWLRIGGQATVIAYSEGTSVLRLLGKAYIRIASWLSYLY